MPSALAKAGSLILSNCTEDSFLIIDELGRGTSTYDGSAIVYAVLNYLAHVKKCRLLFSTHYNFIITSFVNDPSISTGYMSYLLEQVNGQDRVTFLYKLPAYILDLISYIAIKTEGKNTNSKFFGIVLWMSLITFIACLIYFKTGVIR